MDKETEKEWLQDREGCFWDGVAEGKKVVLDWLTANGQADLADRFLKETE